MTEPAKKEGSEAAKKLIKAIKDMDHTRPVTCGLNIMLLKWNAKFTDQGVYKKEHLPDADVKDEGGSAFFNAMMLKLGSVMGIFVRGKKANRLIQGVADQLDIVGYNYGEYRYQEEGAVNPERILVGSETLVGRQWYNWPKVKKYPYLIGDFVWTGFDYIGETDIGQWWYENREGLPLLYGAGTIDLIGDPDAQLYYQRVIWGFRKETYIGVRPLNLVGQKYVKRNWRMTDVIDSWIWTGYEGKMTTVQVFADADCVALLINGKELSRKKIKHYMASFNVKYHPGKLEAITYDQSGTVISKSFLQTAGPGRRLMVTADKTILRANGQDLCYLHIKLTDNSGITIPYPERRVSITIDGEAAVLAGFGSACPTTDETFTESVHSTYQGKSLAVLRAGYRPGKVLVRIDADDCETENITILTE